jgi:hypothetical protein
MEEYKSLYEYLGHAAGNELGRQVAAAASAQGVKPTTQEVNNPKYSGIVHMYPVSFLDYYFGKSNTPDVSPVDSDELPF